MTHIRKAVIPAAGFGTRFLPATKSQPKEMMPIVDTPTIQHVVEEAVSSGITDILMVIGKNKRALEEYFDRNFELETELEAKGKTEALQKIRHVSDMANVHFVWQREMNGLGDAVSYARHHVGDEPFAVLLGDTIFDAPQTVLAQLLQLYERHQAPAVALEAVEPERVSRYGVIQGEEIAESVFRIEDFVEKPAPADAPSNKVIAARYILTPDIFDCLAEVPPGKNNEVQLTDALRLLVAKRDMYGLQIEGARQDIGDKLGFLKTNLLFGLRDPDIGAELRTYIKHLAAEV